MVNIDMKGEVTLVTGAGGCIGKGIALSFAQAGSKVYLLDLNGELAKKNSQEFIDAGYEAVGLALDVTKKDDIYALVNEVVDKEGHIDNLVTCAGVIFSKPFMETTEEELVKTLQVNLISVNNICQAVLKHMIPGKSGKIVNIASASSRQGSATIAHYSTSKFGVIGLTQSIAMAVAKDNINVNAICPGIIHTPVMASCVKSLAEQSNGTKTEEDVWNSYKNAILLGRLQEPKDVGDAALFLCSDMAKNITAQAINVCGGLRFN
ncbi:MAG: SDR family NAD(P)-dependent oxidoreductase [Clostridiaceae bacterium]